MKKHLLLTGFSCTGKTSLAREAFGSEAVTDSDVELSRWIEEATQQPVAHVYEVFMVHGREKALELIRQAEVSLTSRWAAESDARIISLGPGFPLHPGWAHLREAGRVVLFRRPADGIFESLRERRARLFDECPEARSHDNWDVGVMVDSTGNVLPRQEAIENIQRLLDEREPFYRDNDLELDTNNRAAAIATIKELWASI